MSQLGPASCPGLHQGMLEQICGGGRRPMKINVEMEMTPEELRRFMGLPDVQGVQQQMLEQFTQGITASSDQRDEFLRNVFAGAMAPWQNFFNMVSGMNPPGGSRSGD